MAKANWDIWTSGGYEVNTDHCISATHGMKCISGETRFFYNGKVDFTNVRIEGQFWDGAGYYGNYHSIWARANQLSTISNGYRVLFGAHNSSQAWTLRGITRYNASVATALNITGGGYGYPPKTVTNARTAFQKLRLSVTTETDMVALRLEWYNSATPAWEMFYEFQDYSASRITATGYAGFGFTGGLAPVVIYVDDISIYELTS